MGSGTEDAARLRRALAGVALFIGLLWLIELLDTGFVLHLSRLGIFPRTWHGLWGVVCAPLIHGSWQHLISNSLVLLVLGVVLLYGYPRASGYVLALVWLGSGLGVWLFARSSYHFGASGLAHGLMFYIFVSGILRRDRLSIALSLIVFLLYGGMVTTIFPQQPGISYESHLFGAVMGVIAAFVFRSRDPLTPEKTYDWEQMPDDDVWPPAGGDPNTRCDRDGTGCAVARVFRVLDFGQPSLTAPCPNGTFNRGATS
jgi:membrane associated rhomboid family serine protease